MDLKEWVVQHVKHKDLLKKELEGFDVKDHKVEFRFKDRKHDYYVIEELDNKILELEGSADRISITCPNTEENLNFVISNWDALKKDESLWLVFVNTDTNAKWIIRPYTHDRVADPENLEQGLRSMYEQVASE